ncbi:MAG: glycosyltransferase 87 family protein, partial [Thermoleophilia bacterium]
MRVRLARADPHLVLAACAAAVVALEYGYQAATSDAWLLLEAAVAAAGLLYAWRCQHRLRLAPLLGLALAFHAAWIALHLGLDVRGDVDTRTVFRRQGDSLLDGRYPHSEYPVGAVLLFALESWLSGGGTRTANAIAMIPFQLGSVYAIWATRARLAPWLAAVVALWPLNAYSWEFKFDLVPTALLAAGLVLALRGRWSLAGVALGAGALVKWTPGLAFVALLAWLLASRRFVDARRHALAFVATVAVVYAPFLLWDPGAVGAAYSRQGGRSITAESVWYLVLHPFGLAHLRS